MNTKLNPSYRWVIMIINVAICALAYAGLTVWSAASSVVSETFHITATQASLGSSLFMLGYAIACVVENAIANKKGYRVAGVLGLVLMVIGCFGITVAPTYEIILVCRFIQGWGILWLVGVNSTIEWFPPSQRGFASSVAGSGNAIGIGCGGLLASALIDISGNWQGAFRIFAIILLIAAVIWGLLMKNPPKDLYAEETEAVAEVAATGEKKINPYKTAAGWLCALCLLAMCWQYIGFSTVGGNYMTSLGYSSVEAGTVILIYGLIGIVTPIIGGVISDILAKSMGGLKARVVVQAATLVLCAAVTILYPSLATGSFGLAMFGAMLCGAFSPVVNSTIGALPMDLLGNQEAANNMFALTCLVGLGAGGFLAPYFANYAAENISWAACMILLAAGPIVGVILTIILPKFKLSKEA